LSVNQINHPVGFSTATDYPVGGCNTDEHPQKKGPLSPLKYFSEE
jgi:hypothetical protein